MGHGTWRNVPVLTSTGDTTYELNTIGKPGAVYQDTVTGQPLRSHEFQLRGLKNGGEYEYRFGVSEAGTAPRATDERAWTDVRGEFRAAGAKNEPIYLVGDLAATSRAPGDLGLTQKVVDQLRDQAPGGSTLVQTGDLVAGGAHREYWEDVDNHVYDGLGLQVAPVVGDGESAGDLEYNTQNADRNAIFSNVYALPRDGAVGESNYSFDRGDVHVAVLNTSYDLDKQLDWLAEDVRASHQRSTVVVGHTSYFGGQAAETPAMADARAKVSRVFGQLGVDLYLGGHDDVYKRSAIYDGRLAATPEEIAKAITFVTLGPGGPNFGTNTAKPWDDVVDDADTQMGTVLRSTDAGLSVATYAVDGRLVDETTLAPHRKG
nr:metallophosphoesterase [Actinopolymorpha pittospori]